MLEQALGEVPNVCCESVDVAERAIVRVRDCLIERLREQGNAPEAARWRLILDQVNVALSLLAGVEYPAAGIQQQPLHQARDLLKRTMDKL